MMMKQIGVGLLALSVVLGAQAPSRVMTAAGVYTLEAVAAGERLTVTAGECVSAGTTTLTFPFTAPATSVSLTSSRAVVTIPSGPLAAGVPLTVTKTGSSALTCWWRVSRDVSVPLPTPTPTPVPTPVPTPIPTPTPTPIPTPTPGVKRLLTPADVTLLGYYDIQTDEMAFTKGLTHRYVNGDLRLLFGTLRNGVQEVSFAGRSFGDRITTFVRNWPIFIDRDHRAVSWDAVGQRLYTVSAIDYIGTPVPVNIRAYTLNDVAGSVALVGGPTALAGVGAKRVFGGVLRVPVDLQAALKGAWMAVGGGYTSLVAQGDVAALGLTAYALGDPAAGGTAPVTVLADHPFSGTDWYAAGTPATGDRGYRATRPINYFDGGYTNGPPNGDPAGALPPSTPPSDGAQWLSPAPDGINRWVWGDTYWNTHQWVETPTKRGFVAIFTGGGGKNWYGNSTLRAESRQYELHIFDPQQFVEVAAGVRAPWRVQPTFMQELLLPGAGTQNPHPNPPGRIGEDSWPNGHISGATYDATTGRLYLMSPGVGATAWELGRVFVFAVQ